MSEQRRGRPQNDISIAKLNGGLMGHGAAQLPLAHVDTYNEELREARSFVGDRANKKAFSEILENWRKRLRRHGDDPLGPDPEVKKKKLDKLLAEGNVEEAGLVESCHRGFRAAICAGGRAVPAPQDLARNAMHPGGRRLERIPGGRARDRARRGDAESERPRHRAQTDPL